MNRFLTKKRAKDDALPIGRPSANMPSPALINTNTKKGWRWKKQQPQAAPLPELSFVLPTSDNFRTSLIMPNLSARFSMLREQDDPMSILGKASDDSVLEPRRRSRLVEYGFSGGTTNIAESTSFTVPVRPLFATPPKQGSYGTGDGYGTDEDSLYTGSMMIRAKSGEGNVLFGGRQKIFKIPVGDAGSVSNLSSGESRGMRGRALYGDDVSTLAFQEMREKERQEKRERKLAELHCDMDNESLGKHPNSPLAAPYNERRETASSTNSGTSTMSSSTVAPSLTSQSTVSVPSPSPSLAPSPQSPSPNSDNPERSMTRHRKWYEEGLDHHSSEQKSAAAGRLSSIHKTSSDIRNPSPRPLPQSRNALNKRESFKRCNSASRIPSSSPADEARTTSEVIRLTKMTNSRAGFDYYRPQPKNDPNDVGKVLSQAVHPSDRGKATATGTFSKPSQQLDEKQYLQRQMSLIQHQRRSRSNTPTSRLTDSLSQLSSRGPSAEGAARGPTTLTERPWSLGSKSSSEPGVLFMRRTLNQPQIAYRSKQVLPSSSGNLFAPTDDDGDDDGDDEGEASGRVLRNSIDPSFQRPLAQIPPVSRGEPPPMLNHPAMKIELAQAKKERRNGWTPPPDKDSFPPNVMPLYSSSLHDQSSMSYVKNLTSPDAAEDTNLSTLVREHLRHTSNQSSIHPAPPRSIYGDASEIEVPEFGFRVPSVYAEASHWGNDACGSPQSGARNYEANFRMSNGHESSTSTIRPVMPISHDSEMCDPPRGDGDWERELRKQHSRGGSSETWQEREAFAIELAERQRAIQENLKIKVENGSRPPSPMSHSPASKSVFETTFKPFGLLRSGTSREFLAKGEPKLREKLGAMGNFSGTSSSANQKRPSEEFKRIHEGAMSPVMGRTLHFRMPRASEEQSRSSKEHSRSRKSSAASRERRPPSRRSPLNSAKGSSQNSVRARSSSEISSAGRSISHLARHPDDLENAMVGAAGTGPEPLYERDTNIIGSPEILQTNHSPVYPGKSFEASRAQATPRYADRMNNKNLQQIRTTAVPCSARASPIDHSDLYSANSTPPLSTVSTPNFSTVAFQGSFLQQQTPDESVLQTLPATIFAFPLRTARKDARHVQRSEISEPHLISITPDAPKVLLPAGTLLRTGQAGLGSELSGPKREYLEASGVNALKGFWKNVGRSQSGRDQIMVRDSGMTGKPRIRKISSEGGGLNDSRARHRTAISPSAEGEAKMGPGRVGMF